MAKIDPKKIAEKLETTRGCPCVILKGKEAKWLRYFMEQFRGEWDDNYCSVCHNPYYKGVDDPEVEEYCEGRH
jgi:hypothetical protein